MRWARLLRPGPTGPAGCPVLVPGDDLHPHLLLRLPRAGVEPGGRPRGPALGHAAYVGIGATPRRCSGSRGASRRGSACSRGGAGRALRLPWWGSSASASGSAASTSACSRWPSRRSAGSPCRTSKRWAARLHGRSPALPVPGQPRLLLRCPGAHALRDRPRALARAPALRHLPHGRARGRRRRRGARRRRFRYKLGAMVGLVVPHGARRDLLRLLSLLAPAERPLRHSALGGDHPPATSWAAPAPRWGRCSARSS